MTLEEQRIAIAEACGWELREVEELQPHYPGGLLPTAVNRWFFGKSELALPVKELPNYPEDLNAMHEAENTLNEEQQIKFCIELRKCAFGTRNQVQMFYAYHATTAQRAEAFLRCKGLWIE